MLESEETKDVDVHVDAQADDCEVARFHEQRGRETLIREP
jgi:hypothetical protein